MEQSVEDKDTVRYLLDAVKNPKARTVVTRLYGLDGSGGCEQKELAAEWGVTSPRIFQLKESAFSAMRQRANQIRQDS